MNERIDVLAALDALSQASVGPLERRSIAGVRAAVAELIEAGGQLQFTKVDGKFVPVETTSIADFVIALARVGGSHE